MKRTIIATALVLVSGSALANDLPQPSFNDNAASVPAQVVTSTRTVDNKFPKSGSNLGGPTGAATVLAQSIEEAKQVTATVIEPSFKG